MKKVILILISLVFLLEVFTACSSQEGIKNITNRGKKSTIENKKDVREVVYNRFTEEAKDYIKGTWKDGNLTKLTLNANMGTISDKSYIGKEVYLIDFKTKNHNPTINSMGVFVSIDDYKIIGYGYND